MVCVYSRIVQIIEIDDCEHLFQFSEMCVCASIHQVDAEQIVSVTNTIPNTICNSQVATIISHATPYTQDLRSVREQQQQQKKKQLIFIKH